jgi:PAS domain S-box-containing protein
MANVLLVDDRPENLLALEAILEPLGQNLVRAGSGEDALRRLLEQDFAVILLDVQMPGMDGFETAATIKQRQRTRDIPIIFLTAISKEEQHVFQGYEVGAVDYVFKPFDAAILRSKVVVFIDLWEKSAQLRRHEQQLREQQVAELRRASEERYRRLADAMPQIVWTTDVTGSATYYNRRFFEYTGMRPDEADPHAWTRVVHPDDLPDTVARRAVTLESAEVFEVEYRFRAHDGSYRWHLGRALPMLGADGEIEFWVGTATDIHDRKRMEDAQRFLLDAGAELASSLDYRATLANVARLAVPEVADWCAVHVIEDDGSIQQLEIAHVDPEKILFATELQERYPPDADNPTGAATVIATGEAQLVAEVTDEMLEAGAIDDIHLGLIRQLGIRSFICVPMSARARTLGAITLVAAESGRVFDETDLRVAEELAARAAAAIDNAHLYRQAEQRARAARVLETIADGVVLLDNDEVVTLWNAAAEQITGVSRDEVVGRKAVDALPGYRQTADRVPIDGTPQTVPVEIAGRELWLSFSGVRFDDGVVYAFRDLTEERRAAQVRLRRDGLARAAHPARRHLRRRRDAAPPRSRAGGRHPRAAAGRDRRGVGAAGADRQRRAARQPPRLGSAAALDRGVRRRRARARRDQGGRGARARGHQARAARARIGAAGRRRRAAASPGLHEPRRECDQVLARGRPRPDDGLGARPRAALLGHRRGARHPGRRAPSHLREVLPARPEHDPRHRRHGARPLHLPRARAPTRRPDLGRGE